jgi:hypothetical protein
MPVTPWAADTLRRAPRPGRGRVAARAAVSAPESLGPRHPGLPESDRVSVNSVVEWNIPAWHGRAASERWRMYCKATGMRGWICMRP